MIRGAILATLLAWTLTAQAGPCRSDGPVPETIYGASPPVTYLLYSLAPERLAGLNFPPNARERRFLHPAVLDLPVIGGWFGQGRTPNLETLLDVDPGLVVTSAHRKGDGRIIDTLDRLGLATCQLTLDRLEDYPAAYRTMGERLGLPERGKALARYVEDALARAETVTGAIPADERPTVYYAEGPDGLQTECHRSWHAMLIPRAGGLNPHRCGQRYGFGRERIPFEQLLTYDPDVILAGNPALLDHIENDARWQHLRAVREGRVWVIPQAPFNWFDRPPSFMRVLGLQWLLHRLYPERAAGDPVEITRDFYRQFLGVDLDAATARALIDGRPIQRKKEEK